MRTDGTPSAATVGAGDGSTLAEQYVAFQPSDLTSSKPVQPGETAILRSRLTGQFCRLAPLPSDSSKQGMLCDQATAGSAFTFEYTGSGLSYGGVPLVSAGAGQPLVLGGDVPSVTAVQLDFASVGESLCSRPNACA